MTVAADKQYQNWFIQNMKNGPSGKAALALSLEHDTAKRCNRRTLQDGNGSPRLSRARQCERPVGKDQRRQRTCAVAHPSGSLDPHGDGGELPGRQLLLSSQRSRLRGWDMFFRARSAFVARAERREPTTLVRSSISLRAVCIRLGKRQRGASGPSS